MRPGRALAVAAVALMSPALTHCRCSTPPPGPEVVLSLAVTDRIALAGSRYAVRLEIRADVRTAVQAFDLDLRWRPAAPSRRLVFSAHPDFDDDGALFREPELDVQKGEARGLVDLRRGPDASRSGSLALASALIFVTDGGEVTLETSGVVSRPDGSLVRTTSAAPVRISGPQS